ncbi:MAG: 3-hydroxyacyl-CoA dehydrogenase family protein [Vicinamibacteria bacterium]
MSGIETIGVVGTGTMGRRIAFGCVIYGKKTRLFDTKPAALEEAVRYVHSLIEERVRSGRLPEGTVESAMAALEPTDSIEACVTGTDLVIEAVHENVELKRKVFAEIGRFVGPDTLIGSNTSSIPGSSMADASGRPEKTFNLNFGTPDHVKVEVMGHPKTAPSTIDDAVGFLRSMGLVPIVDKKEIQGYAYNRVWRAVKKEVLYLLDGGYLTPEDMDRAWMLDWGTPIGPCGLMDEIGLDVVRDIEMVYYNATGDPSDKPSKMLLDMIEQGKLGRKSGEGFYEYPDPAFEKPGWLKG